jgi:hypothetical protein
MFESLFPKVVREAGGVYWMGISWLVGSHFTYRVAASPRLGWVRDSLLVSWTMLDYPFYYPRTVKPVWKHLLDV